MILSKLQDVYAGKLSPKETAGFILSGVGEILELRKWQGVECNYYKPLLYLPCGDFILGFEYEMEGLEMVEVWFEDGTKFTPDDYYEHRVQLLDYVLNRIF